MDSPFWCKTVHPDALPCPADWVVIAMCALQTVQLIRES